MRENNAENRYNLATNGWSTICIWPQTNIELIKAFENQDSWDNWVCDDINESDYDYFIASHIIQKIDKANGNKIEIFKKLKSNIQKVEFSTLNVLWDFLLSKRRSKNILKNRNLFLNYLNFSEIFKLSSLSLEKKDKKLIFLKVKLNAIGVKRSIYLGHFYLYK